MSADSKTSFPAECWVNDRWVKFILKPDIYENFMAFLEYSSLDEVVAKMELDFTKTIISKRFQR